MIYDTDATMTTMSRAMLRKIGENPDRTNNVRYTNSQGAIGPVVQTKVLNDVVFYVLINSSGQHVHTCPLPQEWGKIKVDVAVMDSDQANLLGTTTINSRGRGFTCHVAAESGRPGFKPWVRPASRTFPRK